VSQYAGDWRAPEGGASGAVLALVPVVRQELSRHALGYAGLFAAIALAALVIGVLLPKKFASSTSILVEQSNIITPLMEGRAVPTGVAHRATIAKEVAFSRKVMSEILRAGGWLDAPMSPIEQDRLIEQVAGRTQISNPRENLIQVRYVDTDPQRAFRVTQRFAEMVITESLATKEQESREAYEFINSQVEQYHAKLTEAEANLEAYRNANPDARPGIDADVNARIGELRRQIESAKLDLIDSRAQEATLQAQLSGESAVSVAQTRASQAQARIIELQAERDRLLLSYTEQHPDVVRVQHQMRDLEAELAREQQRQLAGVAGGSNLGSAATANPLYAELRSRLAAARSRTAAVASRITTGESLLASEFDRSRRIAASESNLAELTRDYEVNRDLYQDLLKRRENARVSMNLDAERRGLSFRIQEPATVPLRATGLRLMHAAGAGLGAAFATPLLLLFAVVKLDPRVRAPLQIERMAGLPVIGNIPPYATPARRRRWLRRTGGAALLVLSVPAVYGLAFTLKTLQAT
jgi:polysaccharide chain length determinant protein (PEP-CTERM system associated)